MKIKISILLSIIILAIILTACLTRMPTERAEWGSVPATPTRSSELVKIESDKIDTGYHSVYENVYESVYEAVYPAPVVTPLPYP